MKCNQSRPGFELVSPCPFSTTITITPRAPPHQFNLTLVFCLHLVITLSSSVWSIDGNLTGTTIPSQSGAGNNENEGILQSPQSSRTGTSPSDANLYYTQETRSIWHIDGTLTGTTSSGQSVAGINGNKGYSTFQESSRNEASPSDAV